VKIFPALVLTGALLVVAVATGVSGKSLKSRATAASDISTTSVRPAVALGTAGTELADPTQPGSEQCYSGGICDDYAVWMALHATP
jgi:hypothetical protein